jgi:type VI protein secretion system component Hcp
MAYFLKLGSVKGESQQVPGYLEVLGWNLGVSLSTARAGVSAGQVAGQSDISELGVTVAPDKACVDIWKFVCGGKPVSEVALVGFKDVAGLPKVFFKLTLNDVYIANIGLSGNGLHGGDAMHPHGFMLKFNKMLMEYVEYKKDGTPGDKPKVQFDVGNHEVI